METFFVSEKEKNQRLDKYLSQKFPHYSRSYFQYLIQENLVLVNGEVVRKRQEVIEGDEVEVEFALTPEISLEAEEIALDIIFEDENLIVVNKPAGMVVHPAVGNWRGTFVNALLFHCRCEGTGIRPGIVHRLDKETSGLLIAAKNEKMQQALVALFASRQIKKEYLAITIGNPGNCTLISKVGRHPVRRKMMSVVKEGGKEAITTIELLGSDGHLSVLRLFPQTGRTHQLRVHLKSVQAPILGDSLYGNPSLNLKHQVKRQLLHAHRLTFIHPFTNQVLDFKAPLPPDINGYFTKILNY